MTTHIRAAAAALLLAAATHVTGPAARAQDIQRRVAAAPDGTVRMTFAARSGVCGNGRNVNIRNGNNDVDWESDCERGPVR
ncbi:MAG: hypothetical protein H0U85_03310, partial [Gemmatimonadales bacterium]|nr:hypothetical protein [Gemmatimonadales bacterium]